MHRATGGGVGSSSGCKSNSSSLFQQQGAFARSLSFVAAALITSGDRPTNCGLFIKLRGMYTYEHQDYLSPFRAPRCSKNGRLGNKLSTRTASTTTAWSTLRGGRTDIRSSNIHRCRRRRLPVRSQFPVRVCGTLPSVRVSVCLRGNRKFLSA